MLINRGVYRLTWWLAKLLNKIYFNTQFLGLENIPPHGNYIVAANHLSYADPFILGICQRKPFTFVAKDTLFKNKIVGFYLDRLGVIPIKRETSDFRALRETIRRLKHGSSVVLFPEGTRLGNDKNAQPGIGFLAVKSGVPIIPAFIEDSDKALPPGAKWFRRYPVKVHFGKPIHFEENRSYPEIAEEIMQNIYSLDK